MKIEIVANCYGSNSEIVTTIEQEINEHISEVKRHLDDIALQLQNRGNGHDYSKFNPIEMHGLLTLKLDKIKNGRTPFDSPRYDELKEKARPFLEHHYKYNDHHPEHFENGIKDMDLLQLMETVVDWVVAAYQREEGASKVVNLDVLQNKYGFSDELKKMIQNTIDRRLNISDKLEQHLESC